MIANREVQVVWGSVLVRDSMPKPVGIFKVEDDHLTLETVEDVRRKFTEWFEGRGSVLGSAERVILDVSSVVMITTPGIGLLLEVRKAIKAVEGRLVVLAPTAVVKDVIHRTQLDRLLEVAQTNSEAMALLEK